MGADPLEVLNCWPLSSLSNGSLIPAIRLGSGPEECGFASPLSLGFSRQSSALIFSPVCFSSQHQVLLSLLSTCTVQFTFFLPPSLPRFSCPLLSRNNLQWAVYLHLSAHPTPPSVSLPLCSSMTTPSLLLSIAHVPSLTTPECKVRPL